MANSFKTESSVLLIAFNRPDVTQKVFDQIKEAKPKAFYFACDGPRSHKPGEKELCEKVRDIVKQVDWDCEIHTLFREENVGCGFGPSGAISWAFETCSRLIVLEDDCCPSQSFFSFCDELLEKYENDKRVWIVSGLSIHANSKFFGDYDYLFSRHAHTWGWATWKDRWDEFDMYLKDVPEFVDTKSAYNVFDDKKAAKKLENRLIGVYQRINEEIKHSWDTQWSYVRIKNGSRDIIPRLNLIKNIGADNGTHTTSESSAVGVTAENYEKPLRHPRFVLENKAYDAYHYKNYLHHSRWTYIKQHYHEKAFWKLVANKLFSKFK